MIGVFLEQAQRRASAPFLHRWNGSAWSSVPNTFNSEVDALYPWNGELYAVSVNNGTLYKLR